MTRVGSYEITAVSDGMDVVRWRTACGHALELPDDVEGDLQI